MGRLRVTASRLLFSAASLFGFPVMLFRIAVLRAPGQLHMFPAWFPRVAAASPRLPGLYSVLARLAPGQTGRQHLAPSAAALSMQFEQ